MSKLPMHKISREQFNRFCVHYRQGLYPFQRFGQAFINKFYPDSGAETADVFHATEEYAKFLINQSYIED